MKNIDLSRINVNGIQTSVPSIKFTILEKAKLKLMHEVGVITFDRESSGEPSNFRILHESNDEQAARAIHELLISSGSNSILVFLQYGAPHWEDDDREYQKYLDLQQECYAANQDGWRDEACYSAGGFTVYHLSNGGVEYVPHGARPCIGDRIDLGARRIEFVDMRGATPPWL